MRKTAGEIRATAQLIHAPSAKHLWADNYDAALVNPLRTQDDILQRIVNAIGSEVTLEQLRQVSGRAPDNSAAVAMAWRARGLFERSRAEGKPELFREGLQLAEAAAEQDPDCRHAWWTIAFGNFVLGFARAGNEPDAFLSRAREAAEKLRALDKTDHRAYWALGWISFIERDLGEARIQLDRAHDLNPGCSMTLAIRGLVVASIGDAEAGYADLHRAVRLSPRDLWLGFMLAGQAFACFALGRYLEGIELVQRAIQAEPNAPANHLILAACAVEAGELHVAGEAIRVQRALNSGLLEFYLGGGTPAFQDPQIAARYVAALKRANSQATVTTG